MASGGISPIEFYEQQVLPTLFDRLDVALPDFGWTRTSRGWKAANREFTKKRFGARPDRVQAYSNRPFGFTVHGHGFIPWTTYFHNDTTPTGKDFVEVVRKLAGLVGADASPLDRELTEKEQIELQQRERRQGLLEMVFDMAQEALRSDAGQQARGYLQQRGFDIGRLDELPFGYVTSLDAMRSQLVSAGVAEDELQAAGLLTDGRWAGRLLGTIRDHHGRLVGIYARDLVGQDPKYAYWGHWSKATPLVGLDTALRHDAGGRNHLVVVEGVLDVALLQSRGFRNVAAIGQATLSTARWEAIGKLGVQQVTVVLDNDDAGRKGTVDTLDAASQAQSAPTVYVLDPAHLVPHKDPDAFVREEGLEAFKALLENRQAGAVYRGLSFLEGVTPGGLDHQKRDAVEAVASYIQDKLHGPWAAIDTHEILQTTTERTGWNAEHLAPIFEAAKEQGHKEATGRALDYLLRGAQAERADNRDPVDVMSDLAGKVADLQMETAEPPPMFSVERLEAESQRIPEGKPSGWNAVDKLEVCFNAGELAIVGARTGHGKTLFLVSLLLNWLRQEGDELLVLYSAEEPEVRVFHRMLSALTADHGDGWTANEVRDYLRDAYSRGPEYGWPPPHSLEAAKDELRHWENRILVVHRPAWDVEELAAHAQGLAGRRPVGAMLVDYLQRLPVAARRNDRRDQEISTIGRRLKALAEQIAAPAVAAAQINREAIPQKFKESVSSARDYEDAVKIIQRARPDLNHLREGGSEQEADLVLGLLNYVADYRTEVEAAGEIPDLTLFEVGCLKNRYGPVGRWARLDFEARYGVLKDPPRD